MQKVVAYVILPNIFTWLKLVILKYSTVRILVLSNITFIQRKKKNIFSFKTMS